MDFCIVHPWISTAAVIFAVCRPSTSCVELICRPPPPPIHPDPPSPSITLPYSNFRPPLPEENPTQHLKYQPTKHNETQKYYPQNISIYSPVASEQTHTQPSRANRTLELLLLDRRLRLAHLLLVQVRELRVRFLLGWCLCLFPQVSTSSDNQWLSDVRSRAQAGALATYHGVCISLFPSGLIRRYLLVWYMRSC